jgi:hypothetical protein
MLRFFATAVPLTLLTIWIFVALEHSEALLPGGAGFFKRIAWPVFFVVKLIRDRRRRDVDVFSTDRDGISIV